MRCLSVTYVSPSCVLFSGRGTRDLYVDLRGRPPVRNVLQRKWVTTPQTARGLMSLAATRGYTLDLDWDELAGADVGQMEMSIAVMIPAAEEPDVDHLDIEAEVITGPDEPLLW